MPVNDLALCGPDHHAVRAGYLPAERSFYQDYSWCLNPCPSFGDTCVHLEKELARLDEMTAKWHVTEVMANVYLLSCALLNSADDYLRGPTYRLPRTLAKLPLARIGLGAVEKGLGIVRSPRRKRVQRWHDHFVPALNAFLKIYASDGPHAPGALAAARSAMLAALRHPLPMELTREPIKIASGFRKQDLAPADVLSLGRKFLTMFPERRQPIAVVGLRTGGSYYAPLLRAYLEGEGFARVDQVTIRPNKGLGAGEKKDLARLAADGCLAVLLDDPPRSGDTLTLAIDLLRGVGFPREKITALLPFHPTGRDWHGDSLSLCYADVPVLSLAPQEWHKHRLLERDNVAARLREYFPTLEDVAPDPEAEAELQEGAAGTHRTRLKRVFTVRFQNDVGEVETRQVLAKSVGWGWWSYHAFLAGQRLQPFVPPVFGLRDGILYMEWLPERESEEPAAADRARWIDTAASYVAARARQLRLEKDPLPELGLDSQHQGNALLANALRRAFGEDIGALLRGRIRHKLAQIECPCPALIDGKMQRSEWIRGPFSFLKTDFEHHGMGKNELNVTDPAYDLAETILSLQLSRAEEDRFLGRYIEESGDAGVADRLFMNKLLAGLWALSSSLKHMLDLPQLGHRHQEFHEQFTAAWFFLTVHAARFCGHACTKPDAVGWGSPLVVLDIDGVIDRRLFGFPCTTAAGMQALSLLHAHEYAVALNSARSVAEIKEYCRAYHCAGGVAEYGSYIWDAVDERGRVLVSDESLQQLDKLRRTLSELPGVFVDGGYRCCIKACTYEETGPAPLPTLVLRNLLATQGLDRLHFHQTTIDTTITAREVNKGTGLTGLLAFIDKPGAETLAIGDSEPDLPMFAVAGRCFAPAQIPCGRLARSLGCKVVRRRYQNGLLDIVRSLLHPDGGRCGKCLTCELSARQRTGLFHELLRGADQKRSTLLWKAIFNPHLLRVFRA